MEISSLAFGGAGVGKFEGMTVFVKDTMPGDMVKAAFTKIKKQYGEAELVEIVRESADRIAPVCEYFDVCGGCQLQYMPYEKQLEFKKQHVKDAFERIGRIFDVEVCEVIGCASDGGQPFFYRNKMEFSFGYDAEMRFALGMHVPGRKYDILDLHNCYLESEDSVKILNAVRDYCLENEWMPYRFMTNEGFLRLLAIREGKRTGEIMLNLSTAEEVPADFEAGLADLLERVREVVPAVSSFYWTRVISRRGQPRRQEEKLIFGKKYLTEELHLPNGDRLSFEISPQAFFQVNTLQAEVLYHEVIKRIPQNDRQLVMDLFCGTGTIGLFMSKHAENVIGIELNESAVLSARENARKNNIFNVDFYVGDVAKVIEDLKCRPSLIVVDPPRAGLAKKMLDTLSQFDSPEIIYVSCNPSTLARDCDLLKEYGYRVTEIQPVDMFPHTFHIECVTVLKRG